MSKEKLSVLRTKDVPKFDFIVGLAYLFDERVHELLHDVLKVLSVYAIFVNVQSAVGRNEHI